MQYPTLRKRLDEYCSWLQSNYKGNVQVRTGALRNSIKVWCTVDGREYGLHIQLNNYWKWIPEAFPWNDVLEINGIPRVNIGYRRIFGPDEKPYQRYTFLNELPDWQKLLNEAFEEDIINFLGLQKRKASRIIMK